MLYLGLGRVKREISGPSVRVYLVECDAILDNVEHGNGTLIIIHCYGCPSCYPNLSLTSLEDLRRYRRPKARAMNLASLDILSVLKKRLNYRRLEKIPFNQQGIISAVV
ncbi:hypothetical protein BOTBODRAFT_451848 [Botryobasidium botryosum FD-172 SS1]|uniref:Uncharacterized protein n=1 Tax=Botryobasidium botryosum (strain FD-172 SS1) TaxID=930990 RepID=A0A067M7J5_BOTB1|nr:hypothetical protein BOTBODRAFT_451848 [Botryobasidium botryosum FD-172 SS1]